MRTGLDSIAVSGRELTGEDLSIEDVWAVAVEGEPAELSDTARGKMRKARELVDRAAHGASEHTYGINTGFGRFVSESIPPEQTKELQLRLLRSHACGVGEPYPDEVVRAAMLLRANALAKGYSGASVETVELLLACLNGGIVPHVPSRGSVGASGDLAPLAHLALRSSAKGRRGSGARSSAAATRSPGRPRADRARGEGGAVARQRHAVHGRHGRARPRPRPPARARRGHRLLALPRGAPGIADELPPAGARAEAAPRPAGVRRQHPRAARRLGDHRVPPVVRQGAGRVLAPLRAAGARRLARPARLRRLHGRRSSSTPQPTIRSS